MLSTVIFDLDGVITHTAHFHYLSWKTIAKKLDFDLTEEHNLELKGVSRVDSLKTILNWSKRSISDATFNDWLEEKNGLYLKHVHQMNYDHILPGVIDLLTELKKNKIKIALGSASKNARIILKGLDLLPFFDAISDGNNVSKSKPNPEVFVKAAQYVQALPEECIVFEDSLAGVLAAKRAKMKCVGMIQDGPLPESDLQIEDMTQINVSTLKKLIS